MEKIFIIKMESNYEQNQIVDNISYKNLYKPFGYINGEWIDSSTGSSFKNL